MKKRLLFRFVNSYLVILLVALVLMTAVSSMSLSLYEKDAMQKNALLLDYVKESFDTKFSEISKLSYEISYNERLFHISKSQGFAETDDAVQLSRTLSVLKATSEIIDEISIYFPNSDQIITSTGRFSTRQFYRLYHADEPRSYQQYRSVLDSRHMLEYVVSTDIPNNKKEEQNIYFYHTVSIGPGRDAMPLLMIRMDRDRMESMIKSVVRANSEYFAILDGQNHIIADSGNEMLLEEAADEIRSAPDPAAEGRLSGSLMILQASSQFGGLHYVTISDKSNLLGVLDKCGDLLIAGILVILVLDMIFAVYFSKRNERPIRAITQAIGQKAEPIEDDADVYAYLENNIRKILDENATISRSLEKQTLVLKNQFLTRLLQGNVIDFSEYQRLCRQYQIDIQKKYHCILMLYVQKVDSQLENSSADGTDFEDAVFTCMAASVEQLGSSVCKAELVRNGGIYGIWLTISDEEKDAGKTAEEYCRELILEANDSYGITMSIASGNVYDSWSQIPLSYSEAHLAMDRLVANKESSYLHYASLRKEEEHGVNKALELLSQYVNCLKLQDYENALRMTGALFLAYLPPQIPKDVHALHRNTLISVVMDAVEQAGALYGQPDYCRVYHRIQSASQKPEALQQVVEETIREIIDGKRKYEQMEYSRYTNELRDYIRQNYTNPNLGLYMVAEHFGMNNTYVSKVFKNEFNIGVLEYINKIRVNYAKEILAGTDLSILQISRMVGYISDITFIRVFKRVEGTTPGRYREGLKEKQAAF